MTAINAIVRQGRVWMITDTALYDGAGVVQGFGSKAFALPHLKMAVAVRGPYAAIGLLANEIGYRFRNIDHFAVDCVSHLREFHDRHYGIFEECGESEFDLVAVGWSEKSQVPVIYVVSSHDHSNAPGGAPPFTVKRHTCVSAPTLSQETRNELQVPAISSGSVEPEEILLKTLEAQRSQKWPLGSGSKAVGHIVGGSAVLTIVDRERVEMKSIKVWSDEIGRDILPLPTQIRRHSATEHENSALLSTKTAKMVRTGSVFGIRQSS